MGNDAIFSLSENQVFPQDRSYEIVERKGLGHPDTLADGLAEEVSIAYSRYTMQHCGAILHHHIDKLYLRGGEWALDFGIADMVKPVTVVLNGRFSRSLGSRGVPVREILEDAARKRLALVLPNLDVDSGVVFQHLYNDASSTKRWYSPESLDDLPDISNRWANDTAVCVAYYPFTPVEALALEAERFFFDGPFKPKFAHIGQDIKAMVVRDAKHVHLTLCVPFMSRLIPSMSAYLEYKDALVRELRTHLNGILPGDHQLSVDVNTSDRNPYRNHVYLSAIGSCIDSGEEGVVGRGNSPCGFIASYRPYSMEAAFGKNPTYHTGRLLGIATQQLARRISEDLSQSCCVTLITQNGGSIVPPFGIYVQISGNADRECVEEMCRESLNYQMASDAILAGELVPRSWP